MINIKLKKTDESKEIEINIQVKHCFPSDPNANLLAPALTAQASTLNTPATGDLIPGASPRKKPRKQQHVISTEESEMVETNSTDEEKAPGRPITIRAERRESPPREYVGM